MPPIYNARSDDGEETTSTNSDEEHPNSRDHNERDAIAIVEPTWINEPENERNIVTIETDLAIGENNNINISSIYDGDDTDIVDRVKKDYYDGKHIDDTDHVGSDQSIDDDIEASNKRKKHNCHHRQDQLQYAQNTPTTTASLSQDYNYYNFNEADGNNEEIDELNQPRRSFCHKLFILLSILTSTTCLFLAVSQLCLLLCSELGPVHFASTTWMYTLLQALLPFFLVAFYFVEFEIDAKPILMGSACLSNWIQRGFMYAFIGLMLMEEHVSIRFDYESSSSSSSSSGEGEITNGSDTPQPSSTHDLRTFITFVDLISVLIFIFSRALLCEGMTYFVLGAACMRGVRDKCREAYADRLESYRDMMREIKQQQRR